MVEVENLNKITGDMSWSYEDVPVTNRQHGVCGGNLHNQKVAVPKSPVIMLLIIFSTWMVPPTENSLH